MEKAHLLLTSRNHFNNACQAINNAVVEMSSTCHLKKVQRRALGNRESLEFFLEGEVEDKD